MKSGHKKGKDKVAMCVSWTEPAVARSVACLGAILAMLICPGWVWTQVEPRPAEPADAQDAYDPRGKRDPFSSPFSQLSESPEPSAELHSPLQGIELEQVRLVGIVMNTEHARALVEDHTGFAYVVSPGTPIGPRGGVVKTIEPRRIIIEEYETDVSGKPQRTQHELTLMAATAAPARETQR